MSDKKPSVTGPSDNEEGHRLTIEPVPEFMEFVGKCLCGWTGNYYADPETVKSEFALHLAEERLRAAILTDRDGAS